MKAEEVTTQKPYSSARANQLVASYSWMVRNLVKKIKLPKHLTEDAVAVGMLALVEAANNDTFKRESSFATYAYAYVSHALKNFNKSERVAKGGRFEYAEKPSTSNSSLLAESTEESPEFQFLKGEDELCVGEALSTMSDQDQLLIMYKFFEDRPDKEIAAMLNIHTSQVSRKLTQALSRLKLKLKAAKAT